MNKWRALILILTPILFMAACEPFTADKSEGEVKFVNKSDRTITVKPQANSGWDKFTIHPGEKVELSDVYDVYFTYSPSNVASEVSSGRVLFYNSAPNTVAVE